VRDYLVALGLPEHQIRIDGRGATEPITNNATRKGRASNRRAEVIIVE
jgi:outer membrane protein OmpA-like peptidoglycan-associated protein